MPSPLPVKPRPSSVVAFTLTWERDTPQALARFSRIWGMKGASLGRWAMRVASMLPMENPFSPSRAQTRSSSTRLSAPS